MMSPTLRLLCLTDMAVVVTEDVTRTSPVEVTRLSPVEVNRVAMLCYRVPRSTNTNVNNAAGRIAYNRPFPREAIPVTGRSRVARVGTYPVNEASPSGVIKAGGGVSSGRVVNLQVGKS